MSEKESSVNLRLGIVLIICFTALGLLIYYAMQPANGQLFFDDPDYKDCEIREFREGAYTPFRIAIEHEPSIRQTISDDHNDPASRLIFDQFESETDDQNSFITFFSNSTDDWLIRVDLEYKSDNPDPREVLVRYDFKNIDHSSERIFHEGFDFCILFYIQARPPPVIPTTSEILIIAEKIQEEKFTEFGRTVRGLIDTVVRTEDINTITTMLLVVLLTTQLVSWGVGRRSGSKMRKELKLEKVAIKNERIRSKTARLDNEIKLNDFLHDTTKKLESVTSIASVDLRTKLLDEEKKETPDEPTKPTEVKPLVEKLDEIKSKAVEVGMKVIGKGGNINLVSKENFKEEFKKKYGGDMEAYQALHEKLYKQYKEHRTQETSLKIQALSELIGGDDS